MYRVFQLFKPKSAIKYDFGNLPKVPNNVPELTSFLNIQVTVIMGHVAND